MEWNEILNCSLCNMRFSKPFISNKIISVILNSLEEDIDHTCFGADNIANKAWDYVMVTTIRML